MARKRSSRSRSRKSASAARASSRRASAAAEPVDFSQEYRYVLSDLKRFGILAVAMFATLIVLALVLA